MKTILTMGALERCGRYIGDLDARGCHAKEDRRHRSGTFQCFVAAFSTDLHQQHPCEGGMAEGFTKEDFLIEEAGIIVMPRVLDGRTGRGKRLHDDLTLAFTPTRTARDLSEQLECPLTRAKVGCMKPDIGVDDPDKGYIWKIKALRDHLGAYQDIDLTGPELPQHLSIGTAPTHCVGIHPGDAGFGKKGADGFLHALSSDTRMPDPGIAAFGALLGWFRTITAKVACNPVFRPVKRER